MRNLDVWFGESNLILFFFSRSLFFPFAVYFIGRFVAHFLSHEILAGFLSNKGTQEFNM